MAERIARSQLDAAFQRERQPGAAYRFRRTARSPKLAARQPCDGDVFRHTQPQNVLGVSEDRSGGLTNRIGKSGSRSRTLRSLRWQALYSRAGVLTGAHPGGAPSYDRNNIIALDAPTPAEADMQRHFRVSPPSVHQMVLTLERVGLIRRQPGVARSIELLVAPENLPILK